MAAYDPQGDGHENDADAPKATDGNPATSWQTEHYTSAGFGGLKAGEGLVLDLGAPRAVSTVEVTPAWPGVTVQIRAGDKPVAGLDTTTVVAAARQLAGKTSIRLPHAVKARYWVVWLTKLPARDGGYRGGIAEVHLQGH